MRTRLFGLLLCVCCVMPWTGQAQDDEVTGWFNADGDVGAPVVIDGSGENERGVHSADLVVGDSIAEAITPDGKFLLVANHLPGGRADSNYVAAVVSVIDVAAGRVVKEIPLPNGSASLKSIRVSPDGKYAAAVHVVSRFLQPTTNIFMGEINGNGLSIIDLGRMEFFGALCWTIPTKARPIPVAWRGRRTDRRLLSPSPARTPSM